MTENQRLNRIKYLHEYINGWAAHYNRKAPKDKYEELESLEKNLPVRTDKEPVVDELANTIIDQWNDRELESKDETVDETAYWFFENLKSKTLNRIADITLVNG